MPHHIILILPHLLIGGALGLLSAGLAGHYGYRAADRMPGESRSPECVYCLRQLQWHEIFPLFGWLLRPNMSALPCPCGSHKNLWSQPAAEIVGLSLGIIAVALSGWSWAILPLCLGLGLLPAIALVDFAFGLIPDELTIMLAITGFLWTAISGDIFMGLVASAALLGLGLLLALGYSKWRGREMLGLGDVKFFAAAGLWLPLAMAPWFLALSGIIGVVVGTAWQRVFGEKEFPFAPALCSALAGCVIYQLA